MRKKKYTNIKNGHVLIKKVEKNQGHFKSNLNEITRKNPKIKSRDQLNAMKNIKNLGESRKNVIELYNDRAKIISKAKYKSKQNQIISKATNFK